MHLGRRVPHGFLPVFSVADEEEAKELVATCCPLNYEGQYFARELATEQTLENLQAFSDKLDRMHDQLAAHGRCRCKRTPVKTTKAPKTARKPTAPRANPKLKDAYFATVREALNDRRFRDLPIAQFIETLEEVRDDIDCMIEAARSDLANAAAQE